MSTITITNAEKALKTFYLDVVAHQLNMESNPFYAKIKQSENNVYGKEVRKPAIYGINGGISAGSEDGELPIASGNKYAQLTSTLKNLYGSIEISDKAIRAGENSAGAFVNLLSAEMDGLLRSAKFNFSRMLYGDGSGLLCKVVEGGAGIATVKVDTLRNVTIGMVVDVYNPTGASKTLSGATINNAYVQDGECYVVFSQMAMSMEAGSTVFIQGSKGKEITGLEAIFAPTGTIYGLDKATNSWLKAYTAADAGEISDAKIQAAIDHVEEFSGSKIDIALCSYGVRRAYAAALENTKRNVNVTELEGGYKAITYAGMPIVADRFVPNGTMYLLSSGDFELHQLCDWRWLEGENGGILRQIPGKPVFGATLVKYAELMCSRPCGQARLTGITEA